MTVTSTEDVVLAIWAEQLGARIEPDDNFFRCGGNSLLAARATIRLCSALSCEVELATLFQNPVARHYAAAVQELMREAREPASRLPLVVRDGSLPLSYQQEARLERERDALSDGRQAGPYFIPFVVFFDVHIETRRAEAAINLLVTRHESLRTGFEIGASRAEHRAFPVHNAMVVLEAHGLGPLDADARDVLVAATYAEMVDAELKFECAPFLRAKLLHIGPDSSVLILAIEHITFDGWSRYVFFDELITALRGDPMPDLEAQYADWAAWHRARLQGHSLERILGFWRRRLAGSAPFPPLALPPPAQSVDGMCAEASHVLPATDLSRLEHQAKIFDTTLFVVLLTGFARAWQRKTGSADVVVHGPTANRTTPQSQTMIGNFAHSLVYRIGSTIDEDSAATIAATRTLVTETLLHQDIPLSLLTRYLQPEAHGRATHLPRLYLGSTSLAQMSGTVGDGTARTGGLPGLPSSAEPGISGFYAEDDAGNLALRFLYRPAEVDGAFVTDLLTAFATELLAIAGS